MEIEQEPAAGRETLSSLAEVVAMVPHRLGFHPQESLVLVLVDEAGRWFATARRDLPRAAATRAVLGWVEDVAGDAARVLLGVYTDRERGRELLEDLTTCVPHVVRGWVVHAQGWDETVPPGVWHEHGLQELWEAPAQLEHWGQGSVPAGEPQGHPVAPRWSDPSLREAWGAALEAVQEAPLRAVAAWEEVLTAVTAAGEAKARIPWVDLLSPLATAVLGLRDAGVRDAVLISCVGGDTAADAIAVLLGESAAPPDPGRAAALTRVLEEVAEQIQARDRATALTLLAWLDWAGGRGSMAAVGLDAALSLQPGHRLASLVSQLVDSGIIPRWLRREGAR